MSIEIHKVRVRKSLPVRHEPHWGARVSQNLTLGFRKISDQEGTWVSRLKTDGGAKRYEYGKHGAVTPTNDYEVAREAALAWERNKAAGISTDGWSVEQACQEYVADRKKIKGEACGHDADQRFKRTVYGTAFGHRQVAKLITPNIEDWRTGLGLGKAASNRTLTALKAALNLAIKQRRVPAGVAREWGDVKPFPNAGKRREIYLDATQRKALLGAAEGGIKDLIEAAVLTGARPGELVRATRDQFKQATGTMVFDGKTGRREVPLSAAALAVFQRLARNKLPLAPLFTRDDGKPWAHSDWDELVKEAAKKAELPAGVCLYTLRHSWITAAITGGLTTLDVAKLCGTSLAMIEKFYGHLVASAAKERLDRVAML